MKKFILYSLFFILCIGNANAADVSRVMPSRTVGQVNQVEQVEQVEQVTESRVATRAAPAAAAPSRTISRGAGITQNAARNNLETAVNTVGRSTRTESASINNSAAAKRAGVVFRPSVAEVGGRATIGATGVQTGSNVASSARAVVGRAATVDAATITAANEQLTAVAELNKSCQTQYNDCMDQFCAVIDANQKRCSCSANLSRYSTTETAVKDANTQLNSVAQRIRYVGLSADEIRAIMTATEAEQVLDGTADNTQSRNMLDEIESLIKSPTGTASSSASTSEFGLDMNIDFSSNNSSDLFNLDFLGTNTTSFANLRGTNLYAAAKKQCQTVLTQCKSAGATEQQITGNYDLAIDKDCLAYESGLRKMNDTLVSNVRSANQMLQKARLAVMQNKNQYDARGCIGALDTCMKDEMVCGADYTKCLDPTKKYIDENGTVVLGQNISAITAFMSDYDNSRISMSFIQGATTDCDGDDGACVARYLLDKIGMGATVNDGGLCRAVLDKCQRLTYDTNGKYKPYNDVVVNYIQRAMVNIKAAQSKIISDYASSCMLDIASCYNQQVSQVNSWSSSASVDNVYRVMRGACRNIALTCAYAVFDGADGCMAIGGEVGTNNQCSADSGAYIDGVSDMFYDSLLCPVNSSYSADASAIVGANRYISKFCQCSESYSKIWNGTCVATCPQGYQPSTGVDDSNCVAVVNSD